MSKVISDTRANVAFPTNNQENTKAFDTQLELSTSATKALESQNLNWGFSTLNWGKVKNKITKPFRSKATSTDRTTAAAQAAAHHTSSSPRPSTEAVMTPAGRDDEPRSLDAPTTTISLTEQDIPETPRKKISTLNNPDFMMSSPFTTDEPIIRPSPPTSENSQGAAARNSTDDDSYPHASPFDYDYVLDAPVTADTAPQILEPTPPPLPVQRAETFTQTEDTAAQPTPSTASSTHTATPTSAIGRIDHSVQSAFRHILPGHNKDSFAERIQNGRKNFHEHQESQSYNRVFADAQAARKAGDRKVVHADGTRTKIGGPLPSGEDSAYKAKFKRVNETTWQSKNIHNETVTGQLEIPSTHNDTRSLVRKRLDGTRAYLGSSDFNASAAKGAARTAEAVAVTALSPVIIGAGAGGAVLAGGYGAARLSAKGAKATAKKAGKEYTGMQESVAQRFETERLPYETERANREHLNQKNELQARAQADISQPRWMRNNETGETGYFSVLPDNTITHKETQITVHDDLRTYTATEPDGTVKEGVFPPRTLAARPSAFKNAKTDLRSYRASADFMHDLHDIAKGVAAVASPIIIPTRMLKRALKKNTTPPEAAPPQQEQSNSRTPAESRRRARSVEPAMPVIAEEATTPNPANTTRTAEAVPALVVEPPTSAPETVHPDTSGSTESNTNYRPASSEDEPEQNNNASGHLSEEVNNQSPKQYLLDYYKEHEDILPYIDWDQETQLTALNRILEQLSEQGIIFNRSKQEFVDSEGNSAQNNTSVRKVETLDYLYNLPRNSEGEYTALHAPELNHNNTHSDFIPPTWLKLSAEELDGDTPLDYLLFELNDDVPNASTIIKMTREQQIQEKDKILNEFTAKGYQFTFDNDGMLNSLTNKDNETEAVNKYIILDYLSRLPRDEQGEYSAVYE